MGTVDDESLRRHQLWLGRDFRFQFRITTDRYTVSTVISNLCTIPHRAFVDDYIWRKNTNIHLRAVCIDDGTCGNAFTSQSSNPLSVIDGTIDACNLWLDSSDSWSDQSSLYLHLSHTRMVINLCIA